MAGLGIGPEDFALFAIGDPDDRTAVLEDALVPKLQRIGDAVAAGLSRVAGSELRTQPARVCCGRRGAAPGEAVVAFCAPDRTWTKAPHLALAVSHEHLHARVGARHTADPEGAMRKAIIREASNLARRGKPFRKLRSYSSWDGEELPEIAPTHSAAFWEELAAELGPACGGIDVGVAWTAEEARNLAVGDLLGVYRDLAPLFKLLSHSA
jgi:hypothetical protein